METERPGSFRKSEVQSLKHPLTGLFHTLVHMWSVPIRKCPICGSMFRLLFPDPRNTFPGTLIGKTGWSLIYVHAGWLLDIVCFLKTSGHRWVPHTLGSKLTSCGNTLKASLIRSRSFIHKSLIFMRQSKRSCQEKEIISKSIIINENHLCSGLFTSISYMNLFLWMFNLRFVLLQFQPPGQIQPTACFHKQNGRKHPDLVTKLPVW